VVVIKFTDPTIIFLCVFIQIVLVLTFKVRKVLMFYFSFEASIIPMLLIIIKRGYRPERYTAALWIVVYTVAGRLPFLFIILISFSRRLVTSMEGRVKGFIFSLVVLMPFIVKFPLFGVHY
jgi:NADH:ubiquinone oxidoreductase subunit 4 (subunit M)